MKERHYRQVSTVSTAITDATSEDPRTRSDSTTIPAEAERVPLDIILEIAERSAAPC